MQMIFTDGSSRGNPGPGGWGAIIVGGDRVKELGGREERTTNNRMELKACIEACKAIEADKKYILHTDSTYVLKGITVWVKGWEANGWMTKAKTEVLNNDLWQELVEATEGKTIEWRLLKGHAGVAGNERCDVIATTFADGAKPDLYEGELKFYSIDILNTDPVHMAGGAKARPQRLASSGLRGGRAYSYVSEIEGQVMIHQSWPECEKRVKGRRARFKKVFSKEEEEGLEREWAKAI